MRLLFIENKKEQSNTVLIGKSGYFRFKKALAKELQMEKNDLWQIAIDTEENPKKHIYIIKSIGDDFMRGHKVLYQNKSWSISAKAVIKQLGLKVPIKCNYEDFNDGNYWGIKLILP